MKLKEIKLNQFEPISLQREFIESFIVVRKTSDFYKLNYKYSFQDYQNRFLGIFYLVSIRNFTFKDINPELSFLHKNTSPEVYIEILKYHDFTDKDDLIMMVFTNQKQFSDTSEKTIETKNNLSPYSEKPKLDKFHNQKSLYDII